MDPCYPTIEEPATPEYVLAVLQDMHRQQCQYDSDADPGAVLSLNTTVAEWREACDLVEWRELGRAYNAVFGIRCSGAQWEGVLEPAETMRLGAVCRLIARFANQSRVRPARLFGCTSTAAGAFLTIRSLLHRAGASATEISPSTRLASYARHYADEFLGPISRLAPGSLPPVQMRIPVYDAAIRGCLTGALCLIVGLCGGWHLLTIAGALLFALCYALTWYAARCLLPASVEFDRLVTFRDLAVLVGRESQARSNASPDA